MMSILNYLPMPLVVAAIVLSVVCAVHVVRSGNQLYWIWIFFFVPGLGALIYVIAVLLPEWTGGRTANRMRANLDKALAPDREYRLAKAAV